LATATAGQRPDLVADDLRALSQPHAAAADGRCGSAHAEYDESKRRIVVRAEGSAAETLAAVVTAGWQAVDAGHEVQSVDPWET
jgi:hypothetical protein